MASTLWLISLWHRWSIYSYVRPALRIEYAKAFVTVAAGECKTLHKFRSSCGRSEDAEPTHTKMWTLIVCSCSLTTGMWWMIHLLTRTDDRVNYTSVTHPGGPSEIQWSVQWRGSCGHCRAAPRVREAGCWPHPQAPIFYGEQLPAWEVSKCRLIRWELLWTHAHCTIITFMARAVSSACLVTNCCFAQIIFNWDDTIDSSWESGYSRRTWNLGLAWTEMVMCVKTLNLAAAILVQLCYRPFRYELWSYYCS